MANLDDYFEKARNLKLKSTAEELLMECNIDFVTIFNEAKKLTLIDAGARPPEYKQRNYMADKMYCNVIGLLFENHP